MMASKVISRILNRSIETVYADSFCNIGESDELCTSVYFDEEEENKEIDKDVEYSETETISIQKEEDKIVESFSKRESYIFETFEKERKYLGVITSIDKSSSTFSAELLCTEDYISRIAVFSFEDIPTENIPLLEVGRRIIYIFGKNYRNGTVTNVSNLYFRKDSNWTEREIESKKKEADVLFELLTSDR